MIDKFDLFCLKYCKKKLRYRLWNLGRETTLSWFISHNICRVLFPWAQFWSRFLRLESPVNHKRGKWAWLYHYFRSQMIALYYTSTYPAIDVHMQAVIISIFFFKYMYQMNEFCTCYSYIQLTMIFICFNSNLLFKKKIFLINIYENRNHALLQYEKCMTFTYVGFSALTKGS